MRIKHLTLLVFSLGIFTAMAEIAPVVNQAFSSTIEIGELQPGVRIYWKPSHEKDVARR